MENVCMLWKLREIIFIIFSKRSFKLPYSRIKNWIYLLTRYRHVCQQDKRWENWNKMQVYVVQIVIKRRRRRRRRIQLWVIWFLRLLTYLLNVHTDAKNMFCVTRNRSSILYTLYNKFFLAFKKFMQCANRLK